MSILLGIFSVIGAIATTAEVLSSKLPVVIETAQIVVKTIATVLTGICEVLGIGQADEQVDELGAKVLQEDTREIEDGESAQEYLDYLRNDVTLDKAKFDAMDENEKLACQVAGISMLAKSIEEKAGVEMAPDFLYAISKVKLNCEQTEKFIHAFADNRIDSMSEFTRYISNDMSEVEADRVRPVIEGALKELSPELSQEEIQHEIIEMKKSYFEEEQ